MPSAMARTASVNSSREPVRATCLQHPGNDALADDENEDQEEGDLGQGQDEREPKAAAAGLPGQAARVPAQHAGQRRQEHEGQDHGQVLDDQPADGDPAVAGNRARRAPRAPAAGPPCSRPRGPGRKPTRRRTTSPRTARWRCPGRWRPRSGRVRREWRSCAPPSNRAIEKCSPTPNIRRMTPISASWLASS